MFVRVNAIFNTWGLILHEGRIGGLHEPKRVSQQIWHPLKIRTLKRTCVNCNSATCKPNDMNVDM